MDKKQEIEYEMDDVDILREMIVKFVEHDFNLKIDYLKLEKNFGNLKEFKGKIINSQLNELFDNPEILCHVDSWNIDIFFTCKNVFFERGYDSGIYISRGGFIQLKSYTRKKARLVSIRKLKQKE